MKFSFICEECRCNNLKILYISINREWTFMRVVCLKCKKESVINITHLEIDAWAGVLEGSKTNGGAKK